MRNSDCMSSFHAVRPKDAHINRDRIGFEFAIETRPAYVNILQNICLVSDGLNRTCSFVLGEAKTNSLIFY
jgi:hypothetical protein